MIAANQTMRLNSAVQCSNSYNQTMYERIYLIIVQPAKHDCQVYTLRTSLSQLLSLFLYHLCQLPHNASQICKSILVVSKLSKKKPASPPHAVQILVLFWCLYRPCS